MPRPENQAPNSFGLVDQKEMGLRVVEAIPCVRRRAQKQKGTARSAIPLFVKDFVRLQKVSRKPKRNWRSSRPSRARLILSVTVMKSDPSLTLWSGMSKCGVLVKLNDSARNWSFKRSLIENSRNKPKSQLPMPGPRNALKPVVPKRLWVTSANAVGS